MALKAEDRFDLSRQVTVLRNGEFGIFRDELGFCAAAVLVIHYTPKKWEKGVLNYSLIPCDEREEILQMIVAMAVACVAREYQKIWCKPWHISEDLADEIYGPVEPDEQVGAVTAVA